MFSWNSDIFADNFRRSSAVEWGSDRTLGTINAKSGSFSRLAGNPAQGVVGGKMAHSLRSMGSAALNYGMVAQGGLDLYWCVHLSFDNFVWVRLVTGQGNWLLALGRMCRHCHCRRGGLYSNGIPRCFYYFILIRELWHCDGRDPNWKKIFGCACHRRDKGQSDVYHSFPFNSSVCD